MKLFDSHAHYNSEKFIADVNRRDELLDSLFENDIGYIVNASCDLEDSKESLKLAEKYQNMYAAVGIHPHETEKYGYDRENEVLETIVKLLEHPKAVAMGEMGLDFHYDFSDREHQFFWFEKQLELARNINVPIIIHDREAHGPTLELLKKYKGARGVLHCYSGSAEMAEEFMKLGYYISFTGVITYKNVNGLLRALEVVPLDRILVETDCPYLSPVPYRSKTNNSGFMMETVKKMAEVKGVDVSVIAEATSANAKELFGIV